MIHLGHFCTKGRSFQLRLRLRLRLKCHAETDCDLVPVSRSFPAAFPASSPVRLSPSSDPCSETRRCGVTPSQPRVHFPDAPAAQQISHIRSENNNNNQCIHFVSIWLLMNFVSCRPGEALLVQSTVVCCPKKSTQCQQWRSFIMSVLKTLFAWNDKYKCCTRVIEMEPGNLPLSCFYFEATFSVVRIVSMLVLKTGPHCVCELVFSTKHGHTKFDTD